LAGTFRVGIPLSALLIVAAGCSGSSTNAGSSSTIAGETTSTVPAAPTTTVPDEPSAWRHAVAGIAEGSVPIDVALDAFAVAFGPVPGVDRPDGPQIPIPSGTGPLRWVRRNWEGLTGEQQEAITAYSEPAASSAGVPGVHFLVGGEPEVDSIALLDLAEQMKSRIEAQLGRALTADIELVIAPEVVATEDPNAWAWASPVGSGGPWTGNLVTCRITFGKNAIETLTQIDQLGAPSPGLGYLMAHEVFHCFDFDLTTIEESVARPPWVVEGLAEWVGQKIGVGDDTPPEIGAGHWSGWFDLPEASLFDREYSAIGFYAHLEETGTEVWSAVDPILSASNGGNLPAYGAATSVAGPSMLETWSPSLTRDASRAPEWDSNGPGLPAAARTIPEDLGVLADGGELLGGAAAYAATVWQADIQAEVAVLHGEGPGMVVLPDGASLTRDEVIGDPMCTLPEGCTCADGTPGASAIFRLVPKGPVVVAVTGGPSDNVAAVSGYSLEDFCELETCPVGSWVSIRWEVPGVDTAFGAGTMILTVDDLGNGVVEFDPDYPLFAIAEQPGAVEVRMEFAGTYTFRLGTPSGSAEYTGGNAQVTSYAFLGGEWVQTAPPIDLVGGGVGYVGNGTFLCEGDEMVIVAETGGRIIFQSWP
jgi:hypothetical protein